MKRLISTVLLVVSSIAFLNAQELTDSTKVKYSKEEKKAFRKAQEEQYLEWERTYFNSPGDWYMQFKVGYGFPYQTIESEAVPPFTFLGRTFYEEKANGSLSDQVILSSTGEGTRLSLSIGRMFNRWIGLEFQMGYINEKELRLAQINTPTFNSYIDTDLFELYADPLLVIQSPNINNFYIYGKIGPHIPFWGKPTAFSYVDDRDGTLIAGLLPPEYQDIAESLFDAELTQDLFQGLGYRALLTADVKIYLQQDIKQFPLKTVLRGVGINASFGFRYQPSPIVSVFGEIGVVGFNVSLAHVIMTDLNAEASLLGGALPILQLTEEGGTALGMPVTKEQIKSTLETLYFNELDENSNNQVLNPDGYNTFNPNEELAPRLNVVSVGFNIGVQVNFPGKDIYYRENSKKAKKAASMNF